MIAGSKLREYREKSSVRPVDVAERMGVPRQRIGQIEAAGVVEADTANAFINAVEAGVRPTPRKLELRVGLYIDGTGPYDSAEDSPLVHGSARLPW